MIENPLATICKAVKPDDPPPVHDFGFAYTYPRVSNSTQVPEEFVAEVKWIGESRKLQTSAGMPDIKFKNVELGDLMRQLNREIKPYIGHGKNGVLEFILWQDTQQWVPGCTFDLWVDETIGELQFQQMFLDALFGHVSQALLFTRTLFQWILLASEVPPKEVRMRMMQFEHGQYQVFLKSGPIMLPQGLYAPGRCTPSILRPN